jgi:hypothetical protein
MIGKSTRKMILMPTNKMLLMLKKLIFMKPTVVCIYALSYTFLTLIGNALWCRFEEQEAPGSRSFFTEIIASISDIKFGKDGRYILSRDYMTLKV